MLRHASHASKKLYMAKAIKHNAVDGIIGIHKKEGMALQIRSMGWFSDLKRQFQDELSKNEELKQNLEEAKRASEKLQKVESTAREALQDAGKKTQKATQYMSGQVSEASQKVRAMYDESSVHEASKKAKEKYENVKEESQVCMR